MESTSWGAFLLLGLFAAYLLYTMLGNRKAIGKSPSQLIQHFPDLIQNDNPALIYCYGPNCSACRSMAPNIDVIDKTTGSVFKLDISQNVELARELGIRAVPTTLVFREGKISNSTLGFKSEKALMKMLQP
jgi:thioredoxin 1